MVDYEVIHEILNLCPGNQMRDVFHRGNPASRECGFGGICKRKI